MDNRAGLILLLVVLTVLSGFFDSQGFIHSAKIWSGGRILWNEVLFSSIGYGLGILLYWITIRFLNILGITSPEVQTAGWFVVTILGVAIFSGNFLKWQLMDQVVGLIAIICVIWVMIRTGG